MKKALIIHVGNNYGRSVKSIEKINPDLVYFIHSQSHIELIEKIIHETDVSFEKRKCLIEDIQSITESYEKSKMIFRELDDEGFEIHVGISNGTKAMVVGLSLASVGYDCEFSYVGSVKNGRENGEVKPGFEKVFDEFHPMKQLATIEINRAKKYFNNYQFSESRTYFEIAKNSSYNPERMDMYIRIVNLYQYWDKFENMIPYTKKNGQLSKTKLGYYLKTMIKKEIDDNENLKEYFYNYELDFMNQLDKNIKFLEKKISRDGDIKEGDIYYYLPDLLNNAQRRIDEEKFDDATARLYRVAELISQIRLYEKGLIEKKRLEKDKVFHIEKENVVRNYPMNVIEYISKNRDFQDSDKKTVRLGLMEDYEVLKILGDELAIKFLEDNELSNVLNGRNNSILAHGFVPSIEDDVNELFDRLIVYAKDTSDNLYKCMNYSEFPKFRDIYD
jgi:CRISPR-associated protein (TIGR02710 family)